MRIPVGSLTISDRAKFYLSQVIESGRVSYGPFSRRFEQEFAKSHGCAHAVFCNSGTSALQVALQALKEKYGWADGDEVIVPALTFVATANIVLHNRMTPVFVDVNPMSFNIDPGRIEAAITPRTRAIIPVHVAGLPCDMAQIMRIATVHGLRVIEDSCETMFARYHGQMVGSFGDVACFSTYVAHIMTTGVGGIATTSDPDLATRIRSLCNHGRDSIFFDQDAKTHDLTARRFRFVSHGHSFRATEFEAALGLAQLEEAPANISRRKEIAAMLSKELRSLPLGLPVCPPDRDHVFMFYPITARDKKSLVNHLEERGIETRDLLPLMGQPIFNRTGHAPIADLMEREAFYIGSHPGMTDNDVGYVVDAFQDYFAKVAA